MKNLYQIYFYNKFDKEQKDGVYYFFFLTFWIVYYIYNIWKKKKTSRSIEEREDIEKSPL